MIGLFIGTAPAQGATPTTPQTAPTQPAKKPGQQPPPGRPTALAMADTPTKTNMPTASRVEIAALEADDEEALTELAIRSGSTLRSKRVASIGLPLFAAERRLADLPAVITLNDVIAVSAPALADSLGKTITPAAQTTLRGLGPGLVPISRVRAIGIDVQLDTTNLVLRVIVAPALQGTQVFSSSASIEREGMQRVSPSRFAVGLTGALVANTAFAGSGGSNAALGVRGFVNIGGVRGVNVISGGDFQLKGSGKTFQRDRITAFVDRPEKALRFAAGDLVPLQSRLAGSFEMLGVSVERDYGELQPERNIRPVGRRMFQLDRRAKIEVYVNGSMVQSFVAEPGPVDIRDIPSVGLNNNVSIVIEDSQGRRVLDSFALGNDITLIGKGLDTFSATLGVMRHRNAGIGFQYGSDPLASAFYARGISERLTLGGHAIVSNKLQNFGVMGSLAALGGVALIEGAGSNSERLGRGTALGLSYRGDPFFQPREAGAILNLRLNWQSRNYRNASSFDALSDIKFDLAADYRFNASRRLAINFGSSWYQVYGRQKPDFGLYAGGQRDINGFAASVTGRFVARSDGRHDVGVLLTLARRLGSNLTVTATADTANQRGRIEMRRLRTLDLPEFEYALRAEYGPNQQQIGGDVAFATSRFESAFSVGQFFNGGSIGSSSVGTLRLQSGIGYVDGHFGIGRNPSRGFFLVSRHPSLRPGTVAVTEGAAGRELGRADGLGPAVIPTENPYRPRQLRINIDNSPEGYDAGTGDYLMLPGARSGLLITVGSDAYRVVTGVLVDIDGKPLGLKTGTLRHVESGETTPFFTNRSGRTSFNNLRPGSYSAELDNGLAYQFKVAKDAPVLTNVGTVRMEARR